MWMRRAVGSCWTNCNPDDQAAVAKASADLIRQGDIRASFFCIDSFEELATVGVLFPATVLEAPKSCDYLLLPAIEVMGFTFRPAPDPNLHPYLCERHFELDGLDVPARLESFIRLAFRVASVLRVVRGDLVRQFCDSFINDPEVTVRCSEHWKRLSKKEIP